MKTAIYLHDYSTARGFLFRNMDFRNSQLGNPGIGGTEYEFIMLAYALANFSECEVNLYCREGSNIYPDGVKVHVFNDNSDLIDQVKAHGNDVLVLRASEAEDFYDIYDKAKSAGINFIAWSHNFMPYDLINRLANNPAAKRIVMVSHEHYDFYLDHRAIKKSTYIHNMFDGRHFRLRELPPEPAVTFTGALGYGKGFHVLAAMWRDILKEVPDATLYVIGSGRLYYKDAPLGPRGIADAKYESLLMKYLTENGEILPSVKFLGTLGAEKSEVYYKTTVGVIMNIIPETFGLVALDAEACGVPVIARASYGLFETVKHGVTGYLGRNPEEIKKYIITLLKDRELNIRLGHQAKDFAEKAFLPEVIVKQWLKLFDDVLNDRPAEYIPPSEHNTGHKRLKILNRRLHELHIPTPAVATLSVENFKRFVKRFIKLNMPGVFNLLKRLKHLLRG